MKTIDKIRAGGICDPEGDLLDPATWTALATSAAELGGLFVVDNVATYTRTADATKMPQYLEDFPTVAPPLPVMFMEWGSHSGKQRRAATVLDVTDMVEDRSEVSNIWTEVAYNATLDAREKGFDGDVKWSMLITLFIDQGDAVIGPVGAMAVALDDRGRIQGNRWICHPKFEAQGPNWVLANASVVLQTIAFLHLRNVKVDRVVPPEKLSRIHKRKFGRPLTSYQHVRLEVPRKGGASYGAGGFGNTAFHIVDGHFAYYGDHHGPHCPPDHEPHGKLFGKLEGVYWVAGHVRGDPERGTVINERTIKEPDL